LWLKFPRNAATIKYRFLFNQVFVLHKTAAHTETRHAAEQQGDLCFLGKKRRACHRRGDSECSLMCDLGLVCRVRCVHWWFFAVTQQGAASTQRFDFPSKK
jgi:hypothetical protein